MTTRRAFALILGATAFLSGCGERTTRDASELRTMGDKRVRQMTARLANVDRTKDDSKPVAMWIMPPELREISGLALTPDGRVITHDDEVGKVYFIDPRRGILLKQFTLGTGLRGDFESIAVAGKDIFMLTSNGILFQFQEGADGAGVPYTATDLHLKDKCELESMVYQADSDWLVMPCKNAKDKSESHNLVVYRWKIHGSDADRLSMTTVPVSQLVGKNKWKNLHPSDITIDPATGNFVMISSHEHALIEATPEWQMVRAQALPEGHAQPEGVAITPDSILMISDEATHNPAAITLYRWHPSQKQDSTQ